MLVVVLSTNLNLLNAPGNILLSAKETGLIKDSVVNVSQLLTLDKSFLLEPVSTLSKKSFKEIEKGLRLVLEL